jgi:hypothetical protein
MALPKGFYVQREVKRTKVNFNLNLGIFNGPEPLPRNVKGMIMQARGLMGGNYELRR